MRVNRRCHILALVLWLGSLALVRAEKSLADWAEAVRPSVVTILGYNPDKALPTFGTAFLLASNQVVSARHVIGGCTRAEIRAANGEFVAVKGLLAEDRLRDLLLLELVQPVSQAKPLRLANRRLRAGDSIFTDGAPLGLEWTISTGIISAVRELPNVGPVYQHTVQISPGNSGGPLLNFQGEVVAVQISTIKDGQTLNFAMPVEHLAALQPGKLVPLPDAAREVGGGFVSEINQIIDRTSLRPVQREDWEAFIPFCEAATLRQPTEPDTWFRLGLTLERSGKLALAVTNYLKTLELNPRHAMALNNLGAVYNRQSRFAEAQASARQAADLRPDLACAWDNLACAALGLKQGSNAVASAEQAVRHDPKNKDFLYNLGRAYHLNGELEKARAQCGPLQALDAKLADKLRALLKEK